jgi:nitrite reductase (NADH) small subunit
MHDVHIDVQSATWQAICQLGDIPSQGARIVERPGHDNIAVFRTLDDQVFAMVDRCPHKGGPLSSGLVHGHAVACPLHNWTIDLATGEAQSPDVGCVHRIPIRLENQRVFLMLDERAEG